MAAVWLTSLTCLMTFAAVDSTCQLFWPSGELCGCDNPHVGMYVLQCERRGLRALPTVLPNNMSMPIHVVVANFSGNAISSLDGKFFKNSALPVISLDLSHNEFTELQIGQLAGLETKLRSLNVSSNKLRSVPASPVTLRLQQLDLSRNELKDPCSLRLTQATHLRMGSNGIERLSPDCFQGWPAWNPMESLDLSGNSIGHIAPSAFKNVATLKALVLDGNRLSDSKESLRSLEPLEHLRSLSLRNNELTSLDMLCSASLPQVTELDLGANKLDQITPYCFKRYYDKTNDLVLKLNANRLTTIDENSFSGLEKRLQTLSLARNSISVVVMTAFEKLTKLKQLDLSSNKLTSLAFMCGWEADSLVHLSVADNQLRHLPSNNCFRQKKALESLDLSANRLLTISNDVFTGLSGLLKLDLSNNDLTSISERAFNDLQRLQRLRISNNALVYLRRCAFEKLAGLTEFHYDTNLLHCDCDIYWLKAFTTSISIRGMKDDTVAVPVQHATCSTPHQEVHRSIIDAVSSCEEPTSRDLCLGVSLLRIEAFRNISDTGLNLTWQLMPSKLPPDSKLSLLVTVVEAASGVATHVSSNDAPLNSLNQLISVDAKLRDDAIYKVCVRLSAGDKYQTDCSVFPSEIQKPTTAPALAAIVEVEEEGIHPGAVAAIVLAVILLLCLVAAAVVVYFMYRKWHSYRPRKEDELADRENCSSNSRRSPCSSDESETDGEPSERSPMKVAEV